MLLPVTGHAATAPPPPAAHKPAMGVTIVSLTPRTVIRKNPFVTFRIQLRVKGMVLDPKHIGQANVRGRGHIQVYVDRIPSNAYARRNPTHWLGAPGKHKLFVALAQNNSILYRGPAARTTITVK